MDAENRDSLISEYLCIIDGEHRAATDGRTIDMRAPSDGQIFASVPRGGASDIDVAVQSARHAFEQGTWSQFTALDRGRCLMCLADLISQHRSKLAQLEAKDTGKPLDQARADIAALARYFEFYGGAADKISGETIPAQNGFLALTLREPHGVVGGIIPWNYPAQIAGRVAGAALAMGNTVVLKPAENAGLSILRMAELALEAGIPAGVLNVVTGFGEEAGVALASHADIDFLTFTGSPEVGAFVQAAAAGNHIGCTLELGGKSPQILFADADLDAALPAIVKAIIQNGGQTCSAGSRVLIEDTIWQDVVAKLETTFRKLVAGPHDGDYDLGAMISAQQQDRVEGFVDRAAEDGIFQIAMGSVAEEAPDSGFYARPRLFGPVPTDHPLATEEVFGPILSLIPFEDEQHAISAANATPYGLVAGVWTRDGQRALRVAKAVRSGQVFINAYGAGGGVELPFGGFKKSGHGREKGLEALYEFSATKAIVYNHG
ncbi:MAG: aldehyde dehydrogenase family protein [Stappiaceae bacterium]